MTVNPKFDPSKHRRKPAGRSDAGQFTNNPVADNPADGAELSLSSDLASEKSAAPSPQAHSIASENEQTTPEAPATPNIYIKMLNSAGWRGTFRTCHQRSELHGWNPDDRDALYKHLQGRPNFLKRHKDDTRLMIRLRTLKEWDQAVESGSPYANLERQDAADALADLDARLPRLSVEKLERMAEDNATSPPMRTACHALLAELHGVQCLDEYDAAVARRHKAEAALRRTQKNDTLDTSATSPMKRMLESGGLRATLN